VVEVLQERAAKKQQHVCVRTRMKNKIKLKDGSYFVPHGQSRYFLSYLAIVWHHVTYSLELGYVKPLITATNPKERKIICHIKLDKLHVKVHCQFTSMSSTTPNHTLHRCV
jgi:hypothetical protein